MFFSTTKLNTRRAGFPFLQRKPRAKKHLHGSSPTFVADVNKAKHGGVKKRNSGRHNPGDITITVQGSKTSVPKTLYRQNNSRHRDPEVNNPALREERLNGQAKWRHDLYKEGKRPFKRDPKAATHEGTKLYVSNLDHKVVDEDIKELFSSIGELVSSGVHFEERSGRSLGSAEAVFKNRADAGTAQRKYNGVQLDGKPMNIELIERDDRKVVLSSGLRVGGVSFGAGGATRGNVMLIKKAVLGATTQGAPRGRGSQRGYAVPCAMDI